MLRTQFAAYMRAMERDLKVLALFTGAVATALTSWTIVAILLI